jgi:hypothetical protein
MTTEGRGVAWQGTPATRPGSPQLEAPNWRLLVARSKRTRNSVLGPDQRGRSPPTGYVRLAAYVDPSSRRELARPRDGR